MANLLFHPAADAFPMMDANRFAELVEDIKTHGQRELIVLCDGMVLDGRNRYRACVELGINPQTRTSSGDPWAFAWSLNGQRRDLVGEQRYLIWKFCSEHSESWLAEKQRIADEANRKRSEAAKEQPRTDDGRRLAAQQRFEDTGETVADQKRIADEARAWRHHDRRYGQEPMEKQVVQHSVVAPDDHRKGQTAKATASNTNAGAVARGDALAKNRPDLAAQVRMGTTKPAEAHREMKRDAIVKKNLAMPSGKFRIFYADPPWSYGNTMPDNFTEQRDHYPTMSMDELCAMPVKAMAEDDAVLFLWVTSPMLEDCFPLIKAWGFKYKASFVWDKEKHVMGHYNSVRHEFLLVCVRGSCQPDVRKLHDSVITEARTTHSKKPEQFYGIIESIYTQGAKIELFARSQRQGWEAYGFEA